MSTIPEKFLLQIVTPERSHVYEEADEVLLPGSEGFFGVLPGHRPFISMLRTGEAIYRKGQEAWKLVISGGFAEVLPDKVTVLADLAEKPEEIDIEKARRALEAAAEHLRKPEDDFETHMEAHDLAEARIKVSESGS